jgi:hypothetical protein
MNFFLILDIVVHLQVYKGWTQWTKIFLTMENLFYIMTYAISIQEQLRKVVREAKIFSNQLFFGLQSAKWQMAH